MNERIKAVRKSAGLKQAEFAARLGIKSNTVTSYETGLRVPSDTVITLICREFDVSEAWLRTGKGDMFIPMTRDEELGTLIGKMMKDNADFKKRFLTALLKLDESEWEVLAKLAKSLAADE